MSKLLVYTDCLGWLRPISLVICYHDKDLCYNRTVAKRRDYIGPTIKPSKPAVVPEGPSADINTKGSKGMLAARRLLGHEEPKLEGKPLKTPLPFGPPSLPPGKLEPKAQQQKIDNSIRTVEGKVLRPDQVMGNTHINSIQALLANDRMEKPRINGWSDEETNKQIADGKET